MQPPRLSPRVLALLIAMSLLVVVPAVGGSAAASPTDPVVRSCSAGSVSCVDTDGDGLDDLVDGCPTVYSANPTGCPSAARKVSLTWLAGKQRLQVRVTSPVPACAQRARIAVWRVRPHRDYKVLGDTASFSGRLRAKVARGKTYYATVSPSYRTGVAECGKAVSRKVVARR